MIIIGYLTHTKLCIEYVHVMNEDKEEKGPEAHHDQGHQGSLTIGLWTTSREFLAYHPTF